MESLASPVANERDAQPQTHTVPGQPNTRTVMADQCVEASPLPSDPEDAALLCSSPPIQDTGRTAPASFSPPNGPPFTMSAPDNTVPQATVPQSHIEPQVQAQVQNQFQVPQALFPQPQAQVQSLIHRSVHSSPSPLHVSVSVPQQQPDPMVVSASLSSGGEDPAVQQHTQNSESNRWKINPTIEI